MKSVLCRLLTLALLCVWLPACGGGEQAAPADTATEEAYGVGGGEADTPGDGEEEPEVDGGAEGEEVDPEIALEEAPEEDFNVPSDEDDGEDGGGGGG